MNTIEIVSVFTIFVVCFTFTLTVLVVRHAVARDFRPYAQANSTQMMISHAGNRMNVLFTGSPTAILVEIDGDAQIIHVMRDPVAGRRALTERSAAMRAAADRNRRVAHHRGIRLDDIFATPQAKPEYTSAFAAATHCAGRARDAPAASFGPPSFAASARSSQPACRAMPARAVMPEPARQLVPVDWDDPNFPEPLEIYNRHAVWPSPSVFNRLVDAEIVDQPELEAPPSPGEVPQLMPPALNGRLGRIDDLER